MKYTSFINLLKRRGLNGYVELNGVKLTEWEVEGLKDHIKSTHILNISYREIDMYKLKIVDSEINSDLKLD